MYEIKKLKNGLKFILIPMEGTKTVTLSMVVGTGSKYENRKNNGISHFLEHMFFKGTKNRPTAFALSSELDGMGAEYNAFTTKEYTGYWIKTESVKIKKAMDILSDMILNLKLDAKEIEREKGVIIEEINMYQDNPMMYIEDIFESCLYGNTPAGWDVIGTKKNILEFKKKDFVDYLNSQYSIANSFLFLVGYIEGSKNKIENSLNKYFSQEGFLKRGKNFQEKKIVIEDQKNPQVKINYKKTDQAHLYLGCRAFGYDHKDKLIAKMISIILGGSMSSRLFINLRERNGLAYYVRTDTEAYTDSGYLATRAGVPVDKLDKAIGIILNEYRKIKKEPVKKEELDRTKDLLKGRLAIQLESSDNLAEWYSRQMILLSTISREKKKIEIEENIMTPDEYTGIIKKITPQDIIRVANGIFKNENLNMAVIGPFKDDKKFKKIIKV